MSKYFLFEIVKCSR